MGYPGRQNIYEATIRRMVLQALEEQEQAFREAHEGDTDQQLLLYLRSNAIQLHHTPWLGEILGGTYIQERFGSWHRAVALAKLPLPQRSNHHNQSRLCATPVTRYSTRTTSSVENLSFCFYMFRK